MTFYLIVALILSGAATAMAAAWDPFRELSDPLALDQMKAGQGLMFAGTDPGGGNVDSGNFVCIEPDGASFVEGEWVLAEMDGPGCITRIWVTGKDFNNKGPRIFGRIKIYIDNPKKPVIDLPIEEFFGKSEPFRPPLAMPTSGGWINFVPIPFAKYCKVMVTDHGDQFAHRTNGAGQEIPHLYHHVNWRKLPAGTKVQSFALPLTAERQHLLEKAALQMDTPAQPLDGESASLKAGQKLEIFRATDAGRITRLAVACDNPNDIWLSATWDGAGQPAIQAPLKDFFAEGLGTDKFTSLPFSFDGTVYTCRLPMPFQKGAVIRIENRGSETVSVKSSVKREDGRNISDLRLHALYISREYSDDKQDMVMLDIQNARGQFVGSALTLPHAFMEGNESFLVDGGKPKWTGTGTEDYFSGGWYFCFGPYNHAFSGCTYKADFLSAYRFHVLDAVPFQHSLKFQLEHGGHNEVPGLARGVVYWYQTIPSD